MLFYPGINSTCAWTPLCVLVGCNWSAAQTGAGMQDPRCTHCDDAATSLTTPSFGAHKCLIDRGYLYILHNTPLPHQHPC